MVTAEAQQAPSGHEDPSLLPALESHLFKQKAKCES